MKQKIYLQLFSVRDYTEKDLFNALEKVAEIGYDGVEFAGFFSKQAVEIKKKMDDLNLITISSHYSIDEDFDKLKSELEFLNILDTKYIVCPGIASLTNCENAKKSAELFNRAGELCSKEGFTLAYHNHSFELEKDNGEYPLEVFFDNADLNFVKQEPDVFWLYYAGIDPVEY